MDNLRIILFFFGAVFILGFFLYYRMTTKSKIAFLQPVTNWIKSKLQSATSNLHAQNSPIPNNQDDDLSADDLVALSQMTPQVEHYDVDTTSVGPLSAIEYDANVTGSESLVIVLSLIARHENYMHGEDVREALQQTGFTFGDMNIYHYFAEADTTADPVCSIANLIEPGTLEDEQLDVLITPGLSLFMQLPGPIIGREALETMLKLGRKLSELLDVDLCDETRSVLSVQTIGHIKEKLEAFHFKQKMANISHHRH